MDTTEAITHVSLCAGYGGIDLGLKRAVPNLRTIAFSEIEAFACANLVGKMEAGLLDAAPIWTNLKTFPWDSFHGKVHILSGGYPCQPFSAAGLRKGADDPRHLWPFIADGIRRMRPELCFFENVEGHVSLGLREVIGELESLGYRTTWGLFSAAEVGAPHQRKRVFIMAHRSGARLQGDIARLLVSGGRQMPSGSTASGCGSSGSGELAHSNGAGGWQDWQSSQSRATWTQQSSSLEGQSDAGEVREKQAWPSRPGQPQFAWEPPRVVGQVQLGNASSAGLQVGGGQQGTLQRSEQVEEPKRSDEGVGNASHSGYARAKGQGGPGSQGQSDGHAAQSTRRTAQPTLGGDADGSVGRMDYAELCRASDNRTDELRLLGNGVVPATAERAFRVLAGRLFQ